MKNNCTLSDGILTFRDGVTVALIDIVIVPREIMEIILPEGIKTIPDGAFSLFKNLSRVSLPESLEEIGERAFECCSSLKHLFIPKNVKKIGEGAFNFCSSLEKIEVAKGNKTFTSEGNCILSADGKTLIRGCRSSVIPSSVKMIGESAFQSSSLEGEFVIPGTVTSIGSFSFADNPFLTGIRIPGSVKSIDCGVFHGCLRLEGFSLEEGNLYYKVEGDCLISKKDSTVIAGCRNSVIPVGVKHIGGSAFGDLILIESPVLPEGLETIGDFAFAGCLNLGTMRFPSSLKKIGEWAIYRSDIKEAVFEGGETEVGKYAFYWCRYLFSVTCPSSVKVSPSAFELCKSLVHSPAVTEAETEEE